MVHSLDLHEDERWVLRGAEKMGELLCQDRLHWEQHQWAENRKSVAYMAAFPLRLVESAVKRLFAAFQLPVRALPSPTGLNLVQPLPEGRVMEKTGVSLIIPTLNAGPEFEKLLFRLRNQKGLGDIQLIVVDSGSGDDTLSAAWKNSAEVVKIPPGEFSHSNARNLGARKAEQPYLVFITQDIMPSHEYWLRNLLSPLVQNRVQAVTCGEIPRKDADLFARLALASYSRELGGKDNDRIGRLPQQKDFHAMVKNAGLSNVCTALPAQLFFHYKFRGMFAEDLDLGVRMLEDGHSLGFLQSENVIHSHNRPAGYFLKRSCVNLKFVSQILTSMEIPDPKPEIFYRTALCTYQKVILLCAFLSSLQNDISPEHLERRLHHFYGGMNRLLAANPLDTPPAFIRQEEMDKTMALLYRKAEWTGKTPEDCAQVFFTYLMDQVLPFAQSQSATLSPALLQQMGDCLLKHYAIWLGGQLTGLVINHPKENDLAELLHWLTKGV